MIKLPELPDSSGDYEPHPDLPFSPFYSEKQMRTYAKQAIAVSKPIPMSIEQMNEIIKKSTARVSNAVSARIVLMHVLNYYGRD